jgi:hypothetical protein
VDEVLDGPDTKDNADDQADEYADYGEQRDGPTRGGRDGSVERLREPHRQTAAAPGDKPNSFDQPQRR